MPSEQTGDLRDTAGPAAQPDRQSATIRLQMLCTVALIAGALSLGGKGRMYGGTDRAGEWTDGQPTATSIWVRTLSVR